MFNVFNYIYIYIYLHIRKHKTRKINLMEYIKKDSAIILQKVLIQAQEDKLSRRANNAMQEYMDWEDFNARTIRKNFPFEYSDFIKSSAFVAEAQKRISQEVYDSGFPLMIDMLKYDPSKFISEETVKPEINPTPKNKVIEDEAPNPKKETKKPEAPEQSVSANEKGVSALFNLNIDIYGMLKQVIEEKADLITSGLDKKIQEEAKKLNPNIISINKKEVGEVKGKLHKKFNEAMTILVNLQALFISGETGSGKTVLAEQLANGLNLPFGFMSISAGISEAHLAGRMLVDGSYVPAEFVRIYENGGVFLLDEVDSADANTLLFLNSAIANGKLFVPNRKDNPVAKRHKDFYLICSGNTWGNGGIEYVGREKLDKAFLDRFELAKVEVQYDTKLELDITNDSDLTKKLQEVRKALRDTQRSVSTRTIVNAHKLSVAGLKDNEIIEKLTVGYTPEEKNKVLPLI